jgi:hypothetical protein
VTSHQIRARKGSKLSTTEKLPTAPQKPQLTSRAEIRGRADLALLLRTGLSSYTGSLSDFDSSGEL